MEKENRLTWLRDTEKRGKYGRKYAIYSCSCGNTKEISKANANSGHARSCGCLKKEKSIAGPIKHGLSYEPWFRCYSSMMGRCYNVKAPNFHRYGGRGITVSDNWRNNPKAFIDDMGERPSLGHSIERIDNNKGYSSGNCLWATAKEQQNNTRNNHKITAYGLTLNVGQWCVALEAPRKRIDSRLHLGWSDHATLFTPRGAKRVEK